MWINEIWERIYCWRIIWRYHGLLLNKFITDNIQFKINCLLVFHFETKLALIKVNIPSCLIRLAHISVNLIQQSVLSFGKNPNKEVKNVQWTSFISYFDKSWRSACHFACLTETFNTLPQQVAVWCRAITIHQIQYWSSNQMMVTFGSASYGVLIFYDIIPLPVETVHAKITDKCFCFRCL